jgi:hypothetical protein
MRQHTNRLKELSVPTSHLFPTGNPYDPDECGLLIGVGAQYTFHDLGNGRVSKVPNNFDGSRQFVGGWGTHFDATHANTPNEITIGGRNISVPHVLRLAARYPELYEALCRPQAGPGCNFTQDKVLSLADVIPDATDDEIRGYLEAYADLHQLCWRYGIAEGIFNFGNNNGITDSGRLVLIDFGEVQIDTTKAIVFQVKEAAWETKDVFVKLFLPANLHDYYFSVVKDRLSGTFDRHWAADLDDLDRRVIQKPRIREHPEEIGPLVEALLERANREEGWAIEGVSEEAMTALKACGWQHGFRLQNGLYEATGACENSVIGREDLPDELQPSGP